MIGGFPLRKFYPELGNAALWCCTEMTTRAAIDTAVSAVAQTELSATSKEQPEFRRWCDEAHDLARPHPRQSE